MPIQFDSLINFDVPQNSSFIYKALSNSIYTAVSISIIFVTLLWLFFPLAKNRAKSYFKLFIYFGIVNTLIITLHDEIIGKNVEKKYKHEDNQPELADKIEVKPVIGGDDPGEPGEPSEESKEIDEIIEKLETETGDSNLNSD